MAMNGACVPTLAIIHSFHRCDLLHQLMCTSRRRIFVAAVEPLARRSGDVMNCSQFGLYSTGRSSDEPTRV